MKVGRNDPCPCGSGKKYKKCHMNNTETYPTNTKHYFNLKGKAAEDIVHFLAEKTFLTDWCYKNPMLPDGKELCDLLVVFDDIVIIWQIKNLKLGKDGKYKKSEVEKNLKQLSGAKRRLFEINKPVELSNDRRGKEIFDPKAIKEVYLISALMGKGEDFFTFIEIFKNQTIHVFDRDFTELVLNELDTIKDFVDYLQAKEMFVTEDKEILLDGSEKELLAFYLFNGRSFERFKDSNFITIQEGSWDLLQTKPEYQNKKIADRISYQWDAIINRSHETELPGYENISREMARLTRFERRYFAKSFLTAWEKADNNTQANTHRSILVGDGTTYCFLYMDDPEPRERRKALLFAMCFIARGLYPQNKKVVGIATEKKIATLCSYDFCLFDKPDWGKKEQQEMDMLQKETGIFTSPEMTILYEDEYPADK